MSMIGPKHIAIIMDGNGRWAKNNSKPRIFGHKAGVNRVNEIVEFCVNDSSIDILTLYTFSSENWMRPRLEIRGLMNLIISTINKEIENLTKNGVKVRILGDVFALPQAVQEKLKNVIESTRENNKLILNLAINYGSKQEIINSFKLIAKDILNKKNDIDDISIELLESKLDTFPYPDPDLLIRTGGEYRLSNFLLWQLAYTEIIVNDKYWPDYKVQDFIKDVQQFNIRERRFGKTSDQVNS